MQVGLNSGETGTPSPSTDTMSLNESQPVDTIPIIIIIFINSLKSPGILAMVQFMFG